MDVERVKEMSIERAHRLPRSRRQAAGTPRDVIAKLSFYKDRDAVLTKARRVKPEGLYFMEDFCDRVKIAGAKLKNLLRKAKYAHVTAFLSFDKLVVVNGDNRRNVYVYDEDADFVKPLRTTFDDAFLMDDLSGDVENVEDK